MLKRLTMTTLLAAIAIAAGLTTRPRTAAAEEGDRCGGHVTPVCRKVELCAAVPASDTKTCTRDYYYFPDAE
jgi:hypothetical protein